jgi:hypothetical protein
MALHLPGVTLVMMDATCPELAKLALRDTLELVEPEDLLVISDKYLGPHGGRQVDIEPWNTVQGYCEFLWYKLPEYIPSKHMLTIQWDGWVTNPEMWDPEYLEYDYVGAPWWYNDGHNVGNGTGLRSKRLMDFLVKHRDVFPVKGKEDELLCRVYRPTLEQHGFKWAPEQLASKFAFECTRPSVDSKHFMFHDSFNFPVVLSGDRLDERVRLMKANPYIQKGQKLKELEAGRRASILDRLAPQP